LVHILVVDDDPAVRRVVQELLRGEGYEVSGASEAEAMRRILSRKRVDLIVLDILLPGESGLSLAREIYEHSDIGIIILTGKGEPVDRVVGLEIGADDYVVKPFDPRELMARVRSVIRRKRKVGRPPSRTETVRFSNRELHLARRELILPNGEKISLTPIEFDLLTVFIDTPQRVLSRETLIQRAFRRELAPFDRVVDVEVSRLRRKIEDDQKRPELIKTVRNQGYVFTASVEHL
jgi:two-component system OmpR family response regulator